MRAGGAGGTGPGSWVLPLDQVVALGCEGRQDTVEFVLMLRVGG